MADALTHVVIHTDGGCRPNPGVGGWAAILQSGETVKELSGGELQSTNNRMELMAAVKALEALKRPCKVDFYTDSEYLKRGITEWLPGWKRRGWKRKEGALKNVELWQRLDQALGAHQINWCWVRGHNGHALNERCDELATLAIEAMNNR